MAGRPPGGGGSGGRADLLKLFVRVCEAVDAAHQAGVVHRDLKPSNILVTDAGDPYVVDFGLARFVPIGQEATDDADADGDGTGGPNALTITGQFLGSLPWASPEQADGRAGQVDARSDVYALGVILYQLLTGGRFPYAVVGSMRDVLDNILTARPTPPSRAVPARDARRAVRARGRPKARGTVDPRLEAVVLKALSKRREDRYATAGELGRDVQNVLAGRPTAAGRGRPAGGRRRAAGLVVLALVLAAGVVVAVAARQPRPPGPGASAVMAPLPAKRLLVRPIERSKPFQARVKDRTLVIKGGEGTDLLLIQDAPGYPEDYKKHLEQAELFDPAEFDAISVDLGAGGDQLDVHGACGKPLTILGGPGDDHINICPYGTQWLALLNVPVHIDGGGGNDFVEVFDFVERGDRTYRLEAGLVWRTDLAKITYANVETLGVNGGHGNDLFEAEAAMPGMQVGINGTDGDDTVHVARRAGRMDAGWSVSVGGGQGDDALHLYDTNEVAGHTYTIQRGRAVSRTGANDIFVGQVERLHLSAGRGDDVIDAATSSDILALMIDGGPGNDRFTGGEADDTFVGGPGADRFAGGPGRDVMRDFNRDEGDEAAADVEELVSSAGTRPATRPATRPTVAPAAGTRPAG